MEARTNTSAAPEGRPERREFPRRSVDTNAIIYLIDVGLRLPGRILNLSLGGCLIRTDDRFPTGIFRRVEVEFSLEGMPFRLPAVTQAIHLYRNIGIRFVGLSDRKREHLVRLMREIEESLAPDRLDSDPT